MNIQRGGNDDGFRNEPSKPPCPICDDMGFTTRNVPIGHPDFGKAFPCECKVDELADRKAAKMRKISNLATLIAHFRFDTFL